MAEHLISSWILALIAVGLYKLLSREPSGYRWQALTDEDIRACQIVHRQGTIMVRVVASVIAFFCILGAIMG